MGNNMTISKILKVVQSFTGYKQVNMCDKKYFLSQDNINPTTMSNWFNGKSFPESIDQDIFANALIKVIEEFLDSKENMKRDIDRLVDLLKEKFGVNRTTWQESIRYIILVCYVDHNERKQDSKLALQDTEAFDEYIRSIDNNVFIASRELFESETRSLLSFEKRMQYASEVWLVNFASTAVLNPGKFKQYEENPGMREEFHKLAKEGKVQFHFCLCNPHSYAGRDAAECKMNPHSNESEIDYDMIILDNIRELKEFISEYPNVPVDIRLTDIALPYAIQQIVCHGRPKMNSMKIDLYSANDRQTDTQRPSFFLLGGAYRKHEQLYNIFDSVRKFIYAKSKPISLNNFDLTWIGNKENPFIHRGKYCSEIPEHSIEGYWECIKHGLPMEVDILPIQDEILLGRDYTLYSRGKNKKTKKLSDMTLKEIRGMKTNDYRLEGNKRLPFKLESVMTLEEFLSLVNKKVDLLLELKLEPSFENDNEENEKAAKELVMKVIHYKAFHYYSGRYMVHCANPWVVKMYRKIDPTVPCGQISWSFKKTQVPEYYQKIHCDINTLCEISNPDFISYKLSEMEDNEHLFDFCQEKKLPLLVWTVKQSDDMEIVKHYSAYIANIITEEYPPKW